ncbi:hypothetical protein HAZT_HAZT001809 [Hyalella azteca]|uniref:DH domain-containing protein n=1 Tax=Hyalella azteca TaxID=294128 RepID=A0A6A0H8L9_HYAAZ|nr:hypothetical protein HAZT_HAZT001809 [Hyalella azteca]
MINVAKSAVIFQIILAAKQLQKSLQSVSFNSDDELDIGAVFLAESDSLCDAYKTYCAHHTTVVEPLLSQVTLIFIVITPMFMVRTLMFMLDIGAVFLAESDSLCDAYKTYCAHHTTVVEPLLSQYGQHGVKRKYMEQVLKELQQHKIQLLDMRSVLIKPVQRILKYPLFLDRLLSYTPPGEPQHDHLTAATQRMADVANAVNTHTRRMDIVRKYGSQGSSGAPEAAVAGGGRMGRLSLHSIAKKSARVTSRLSASLGLSTLPEDVHMTTVIAEYRAVLTDVATLQQQAHKLQQLLSLRHKSELALTEGLAECLLAGEGLPRHYQDVLDHERTMNEMVQVPLQTVLSLTNTTERLLVKREHKLLDYDRAQHKMDRNRDPGRTRVNVADGEAAAEGQRKAACEKLLQLKFIADGHFSFRATSVNPPAAADTRNMLQQVCCIMLTNGYFAAAAADTRNMPQQH